MGIECAHLRVILFKQNKKFEQIYQFSFRHFQLEPSTPITTGHKKKHVYIKCQRNFSNIASSKQSPSSIKANYFKVLAKFTVLWCGFGRYPPGPTIQKHTW